MSSSYSSKFLKGGFWTLMGTGIARVSTFVMMTLLARMLGPEDFGAIGILQGTLGVIGTFAGLGLSSTALRFVAANKDANTERAGRLIALLVLAAGSSGCVALVFGILIAPWLADAILQNPNLSFPLILGSPLLFFSLVAGVRSGELIGFQNFRALAIVNLLDGVLGLILTLVLVSFFHLEGFVIALLLKSVAMWGFLEYMARDSRRHYGILLDWRNAWRERGLLVGFSLPAFLSSMSYAPIMWAGQTLLARNSGYDQLGLFFAAAQINFLVTAFMTVFAQVSVSLLSESAGRSCSTESYNRRFNLTLRLNLTIACFTGFCISLWPAGAASIFGSDFAEASNLIPIAIAFAAVNVGCGTCGQFFSSADRMWVGLGMTILWGVCFLVCFVAFGVNAGAQGLALALLIAYWVALTAQLVSIRKQQGPSITEGLGWTIGFLLVLTIIALLQSFGDWSGLVRILIPFALASLTARFILHDGKQLLRRLPFRSSRDKGLSS